MTWSIVKTWAKDQGYKANREKNESDTNNSYTYIWSKIDEPDICGTTTSLSKLAAQIYNNITNNKYVEYQTHFKEKKNQEDIDHNGFSEGWK